MHVGDEVGRGVRSVVYALDDDAVAKVPHRNVPPEWLIEELRLTDAVARCGASVPTDRRLIDLDGRAAYASRRVYGPSMSQVLRARPGDAALLGAQLAGIQDRLARLPPSFELPAQRDRILGKVHRVAAEHGDDLLAILELVRHVDAPLMLCHGDLHPRNVLLPAGGPVLVDWFDASRGLMVAEIARTLIIIDADDVDPWGSDPDVPVAEFRAAYLAAACQLSGTPPDALGPWMLLQRIARVSEGFGVDLVDELRAEMDAVLG